VAAGNAATVCSVSSRMNKDHMTADRHCVSRSITTNENVKNNVVSTLVQQSATDVTDGISI